MAITLDAITLPEDLIWIDEYSWTSVVQNQRRALSGALIIQENTQIAGRPITLTGDSDSAWITKTTLDAIKAKNDTADLDMTLDYHNTTYTVRFDRSSGSPLEVSQIFPLSNPQADHIYSITLKLITV
jgi:hypothetical protein